MNGKSIIRGVIIFTVIAILLVVLTHQSRPGHGALSQPHSVKTSNYSHSDVVAKRQEIKRILDETEELLK